MEEALNNCVRTIRLRYYEIITNVLVSDWTREFVNES